MKITIELDGTKLSASATADAAVHRGDHGGDVADGGASPGGGDLSATPASGEADGGGPGQALLDAIAAAEAAGLTTADAVSTNETDAGAGPSGD